jgi:hypothetical protein
MNRMTIEQAKDFMNDSGVRQAADDIIESLCHLYGEDDVLMPEFDRWADAFLERVRNSEKAWEAYESQASDEFIITVAEYAYMYGKRIDGEFYWD